LHVVKAILLGKHNIKIFFNQIVPRSYSSKLY